MKSFVTPVFALSLLLLGLLQTAVGQSPKHADDSARLIKATGCVRPGVEAGCLVLSDLKTQKIYTLYFTGEKPLPDTVIEFVGVVHDGPTTCMQGTAVNVKKWTASKMKCGLSLRESAP